MFQNFKRILKFGWQNFYRSLGLSVVTIVIISLTLISISSLVIFKILSDNTLKAVQAKTDVYIDFDPNVTFEQANQLVSSLSEVPTIKEVKYISSEENLDNFLNTYGDNSLIAEAVQTLDNNPFKPSLMIKVDDIDHFPLILEELSQNKYAGILEIDDRDFTQTKTLINKISEYSQKINKAGIIISLIFILVAILVVFNAIQISIYSRHEEITIMRLVGASNQFIKGPFFIEGIFYSFFSLLILLIILYPLLVFVQPYIDNFFSEYATNLVTEVSNNFLLIFGVEFVVAILINILSASFAMRKYLRK